MKQHKAARRHHRSLGSVLAAFFRGSVILQMLDRLSYRIYRSFGEGFFGWLFTGYRTGERSGFLSRIEKSRIGKWGGRLSRFFCRQIEESMLLGLVRSLVNRLLRCRMRTFGIFLVTFGIYTSLGSLMRTLMEGKQLSLRDAELTLFFALGLICVAIPLLLSRITLVQSLCDTYVGSTILLIFGFSADRLRTVCDEGATGRSSIAFLCGIGCGLLTMWVAPWWILLALCGMIALYLLLCKPELGVMVLFAAMPHVETMTLAAMVILTFLCFFLKLLRRKRTVTLEPLDVLVMTFAVILFFGGFVSLSTASRKPALLFICFLLGYFETVWLLRERGWLVRCAVTGVLSATASAALGIFQYLTGTSRMAEAWVDSEMFAIGGRAIGGLENPNMFGEYLILMIPLALVMLVGQGEGLRRIPAFFCLGILGACLIFTWSRGAWLGMLCGLVVFLFLWHRRAVWLLFAGVAAIPILPYVLPASIIQRFTSIGNMADSSTSYRVYIWRAACDMLRDHGFTGIGIGEGAWFRMYPAYAYQGIEAAPHSHNLFLQIWLETGICGLLVFIAILFFLCQSFFTLCRDMSGGGRLDLLSFPDMPESSVGMSASQMNRLYKRTGSQIRISAAAPLAGIFAVLVQGMTDYAWYNYRLYLMFWLMVGLASAYVRVGRSMFTPTADLMLEPEGADLTLPYRTRTSKPGKERGTGGNAT